MKAVKRRFVHKCLFRSSSNNLVKAQQIVANFT